jgi:hypothetical protein
MQFSANIEGRGRGRHTASVAAIHSQYSDGGLSMLKVIVLEGRWFVTSSIENI